MEVDEDLRKVLKPAGLVTRDPRAKERYKYGLKKHVVQLNSQNVNIYIHLKTSIYGKFFYIYRGDSISVINKCHNT